MLDFTQGFALNAMFQVQHCEHGSLLVDKVLQFWNKALDKVIDSKDDLVRAAVVEAVVKHGCATMLSEIKEIRIRRQLPTSFPPPSEEARIGESQWFEGATLQISHLYTRTNSHVERSQS